MPHATELQMTRGGAEAGEGEVSHCVSNLIRAFVDGLDVFKRLRERRRKKKGKKSTANGVEQREKTSGAELQLSNSLRRAPKDIESAYQWGYGMAGEKFAKGDATAHVSLAETLIKLNTGLVGIIAAFLNRDHKSGALDLDYKSLTNLSNASRVEAVESLNQLYQRLSQSQLQLQIYGNGFEACPRCGSTKHRNCSPAASSRTNRSRSSSKTRSNGPTIARMPTKSSGQTQLVIVRPKANRKDSSSSKSSSSASSSTPTKSRVSASSSPVYSPLYPSSPPPLLEFPQLPQYSPEDPYARPIHPAYRKGVDEYNAGSHSVSIEGPRPIQWPPVSSSSNAKPPVPPKHLALRSKPPQTGKTLQPVQTKLPTPPTQPPVVKRRLDKSTPSTYTFASDSTKLGEIPQGRWIQPFDYEEAERLNNEIAARGHPLPAQLDGGQRGRQKRGLFGFLRRGSGS